MAGSTTARGYGAAHQAEREKWKPSVERGEVDCHAKRCKHSSRWIEPGTPWDLGHTEDRTAYTGPEHRDCNRSDGGKRRGKKPVASRRWVL